MRRVFILAILAALLPVHAIAQINAALFSDPAPDGRVDASDVTLKVKDINATFYLAAGEHPHPTVVLANDAAGDLADLAQVLRRAGWNVLLPERVSEHGGDTVAAVALVLDAANIVKYRVDAKHIAVVGHGIGAWDAARAAAEQSAVAGVVMIAPVAGDVSVAAKLASRPVLLVSAEDGSQPRCDAIADALKKANDGKVLNIHMRTDHAFAMRRVAMESLVVDWLASRVLR